MSGETADGTRKMEPRREEIPSAAATAAEAGKQRSATGDTPGSCTGEQKVPGAGVTDVGTYLAYERTDMAVQRNYLASERTLMGWIRTALSMISFGFTIGKLGQTLHEVEFKGVFRVRTVSIQAIAYFLVVIGTVALFGATAQHILRVREYRTMGYRRRYGIAVWVAILLVLVGGFALTALVAKL